MQAQQSQHSFIIKSALLFAESQKTGIEGALSTNPHQSDKLYCLDDQGRKVIVAKRGGTKGGVEFNKLISGKVLAVIADGFSPQLEKQKEGAQGPDKGRAPPLQKTEDGKLLFSSSGFYLASTKEYPSLISTAALTKLDAGGLLIRAITQQQLFQARAVPVASLQELNAALRGLRDALSDEHVTTAPFAEQINKARKRAISRAQEDAEDEGAKYEGVQFAELAASPRDGAPFVALAWECAGQLGCTLVTKDRLDNTGKFETVAALTTEEAVALFSRSTQYRFLADSVKQGQQLRLYFVSGNTYRSSVSFKKKVENAKVDSPKNKYGDAVFINGISQGWAKGFITVMHSMHPAFPSKDYDALHFVASARQSEIRMCKNDQGSWNPPEVIHYELAKLLQKMAAKAG